METIRRYWKSVVGFIREPFINVAHDEMSIFALADGSILLTDKRAGSRSFDFITIDKDDVTRVTNQIASMSARAARGEYPNKFVIRGK